MAVSILSIAPFTCSVPSGKDRVRIVWWDGSGVCLYSKVIEGNGFCWPAATAARIRLDHAQLMALLAGMDWEEDPPGDNQEAAFDGLNPSKKSHACYCKR